MAEKQATHRQQLETTHLQGTLSAQKWGIVAATVISLATIGAGTFLIYQGKSGEGLATLLSGIATLAGVFIYGTRRQAKEQQQKRDTEKR